MSKAYIPTPRLAEKHLHIRALMNQKLTHLIKTGKLKLDGGAKVKFPKITLKPIKFKKGS